MDNEKRFLEALGNLTGVTKEIFRGKDRIIENLLGHFSKILEHESDGICWIESINHPTEENRFAKLIARPVPKGNEEYIIGIIDIRFNIFRMGYVPRCAKAIRRAKALLAKSGLTEESMTDNSFKKLVEELTRPPK